MKLRSRTTWAVLALLAAVLAVLAYLQRPEIARAPIKTAESLLTPPLAAPASAQALTEKAQPPAPITRIDPRFEICRNPQWSLDQMAERLSSSEAQLYLTRQTEDLRQAAIGALLRDGADEQQQVAGLLLRGDTDKAAMLAASSSDGRVYGVAWRACQSATAAPSAACAALNLDRWAQLEPDNAAPWLAMLSRAQQGGDRAQAINAMHRAALARELDNGWGWLTNQVTAALPAELPENGQMGLLTDMSSMESGWLPVQANGPTSYCRGEALADANTRQQCEDVAFLLMTRARTVIDAAIGVNLGQKLGMSGERLPLTRAQVDAGTRRRADAFVEHLQNPSACEGTRAMIADIRESARIGEWPAVQAFMKSRPPTQPLSRP